MPISDPPSSAVLILLFGDVWGHGGWWMDTPFGWWLAALFYENFPKISVKPNFGWIVIFQLWDFCNQLYSLLSTFYSLLSGQFLGEYNCHIQSCWRAEMTARSSEPQEASITECRPISPAHMPSTKASCKSTSSIAIDGSGNVYIASLSRQRLRSPTSTIQDCSR